MRIHKGMLNQYAKGTRRPTRTIDRTAESRILIDAEREANHEYGDYSSEFLSNPLHLLRRRGYALVSEMLLGLSAR